MYMQGAASDLARSAATLSRSSSLFCLFPLWMAMIVRLRRWTLRMLCRHERRSIRILLNEVTSDGNVQGVEQTTHTTCTSRSFLIFDTGSCTSYTEVGTTVTELSILSCNERLRAIRNFFGSKSLQ